MSGTRHEAPVRCGKLFLARGPAILDALSRCSHTVVEAHGQNHTRDMTARIRAIKNLLNIEQSKNSTTRLQAVGRMSPKWSGLSTHRRAGEISKISLSLVEVELRFCIGTFRINDGLASSTPPSQCDFVVQDRSLWHAFGALFTLHRL
jgi:hypothetical protein